jgi:nucleotide-binding universal stress UspA family protein
MFQKVLIPTDGSSGSSSVVEQGIEIASNHDAAVHALYVVDTRAFLTLETDLRADTEAQLREQGEAAVQEIVDAAREAGLDATAAIREGSPADEIVDYVRSRGVDLVVMGSHAETDYEHNMLGSVSATVVQESPVSVLTVRFSERDA